jgi:uncharacterized protein YjbI with pentapeptide repeats
MTIWKKIIDYYQSTLCWSSKAPPRVNDVNQTVDSARIFALLNGLPFREEVSSARNLRGRDFGHGWRSDFSDTDFSLSKSVGPFFHSNLRGARFDQCVSEYGSFGKILDGASFRNAKLRSCFIHDSQARNCCFDGADLCNTSFGGTNLSGSSFRNARCKRAGFYRADLTGCDFRGANLEESSFREALIDKTTDFRGASLINARHDDSYNNAGELIARGVDLRQATYDESTRFGKDPLAFPIEYNQRAIEIAAEHYGEEGRRIAGFIRRRIDEMLAKGQRSIDWEKQQIAQLNEPDRALYEEIMDEAFKSLR